MTIRAVIRTVAICCCAGSPYAAAAPLGTGFTYQGQITQNSSPVNGAKTLRFSLWDAQSTTPGVGGNQIGNRQLLANVPVSNGTFTVVLNAGGEFGPNAFNGDARFLQIEVCEDVGCGVLTVLSPRQPVTAAPYALGPWNPVGGNLVFTGGNVGIGTASPTVPLNVHGPVAIVSEGNQADALWLGIERSWVFRQEGTGAVTALKMESVGGGGNKNFVIQTAGGVGIGTTAPGAKLDARGDIRLGSSGEYAATAGEENLRMIRGQVTANGDELAGSGFTVASHPLVGRYEISFTTPFLSRPTVTASADLGPFSITCIASIEQMSTTGVVIIIVDRTGSYTDRGFHLIAVGPR